MSQRSLIEPEHQPSHSCCCTPCPCLWGIASVRASCISTWRRIVARHACVLDLTDSGCNMMCYTYSHVLWCVPRLASLSVTRTGSALLHEHCDAEGRLAAHRGGVQERDGHRDSLPQRSEHTGASALRPPGGWANSAGHGSQVLCAAVSALPCCHPSGW